MDEELKVGRDGLRGSIFFALSVLVVGISLGVAWISGGGGIIALMLGVMTATVLSSILGWLYRRTLPTQRRGKIVAGTQRCPNCESLQTDEVSEVQPNGEDALVWRCFACDHQW